MFFRLLPEVYLTVGKKKSLLQNILNKKSLWINNEIASLIIDCEQNRMITEENSEILNTLSKNGWGTLSKKNIFVDKLRLTNIFNEKKFFKDTPFIHSAILKLTNDCNSDCESCYNAFCPICFRSKKADKNVLSLEEWKNVVCNLHRYGCKSILLTGGESTLYPHIRDLYDFISGMDILPTICTNGKKPINFAVDTHIVIPILSGKSFFTIVNNFKKFKNVMLIVCCGLDNSAKKMIPSSWKYINSITCAPQIQKNNLSNSDIYNFFARKDKNKCLNNKIAILENGEVYPCLGACTNTISLFENCVNYYKMDEKVLLNKKVGNIRNDLWVDIIKKLMANYWGHKVDNNPKCKQCEFRYTCDSCLFNDVSKNCFYNVEEAIWK